MRLYIASSWRNAYYETLVELAKAHGHQVWNWKKPPTGGSGFKWQDTGASGYKHGDKITPAKWLELLNHPTASAGFASDLAGMNWCDVGILLHPCGRSAHLEAGWIAGRGKKVHVLVAEDIEPDLMVLALNGGIFSSSAHLFNHLTGKQ